MQQLTQSMQNRVVPTDGVSLSADSDLSKTIVLEDDRETAYYPAQLIHACVLIGGFVFVFLYLLGLFIFFSRRLYFFFLALTCLVTAVRMTFLDEKLVKTLLPGFSLTFAVRVEYLCLVLFVALLQLYYATLYPGRLNRYFVATIVSLSAVYGICILFADVLFFTSLMEWYAFVRLAAAAMTLWTMSVQVRRKDMHTALIFTGLVVFAATAVFDVAASQFIYHAWEYNSVAAGVLIGVFTNMIALTLNYAEIETALQVAKSRQKALNVTNRLLDRLNRMKTQFMANISHEMKTPLTVMSVHAQLSKALLSSGADKEEIVQSLDTISQESKRLARMVGGVLDLMSMQESESDMEKLAIGTSLRHAAEAYRAMFEKKGNALILNIPESLPTVYGNADALTQVVLNVFANANHYTSNGQITVSAEAVNGNIRVTVRDTGKGIPLDILPHVFERHVAEKENGGTGLGLAICKSIIERHNGSISIDIVGKTKGGGTEVQFILPTTAKGEK